MAPTCRKEQLWANTCILGLLLRVAKVPSLAAAPTYNYLQQQKHYQTVIQPILGHNAVHQELVVLRESDIIGKLNGFLQSIAHRRKDKFKGSFVGQSDWGFLVEDMQPRGKPSLTRSTSNSLNSAMSLLTLAADSTDTLLIEFKPKWLLQSPSAPKDAVRCRQCALNLQTFVEKPECSQAYSPTTTLCPIALVQDAPWPANSPFRIAPHLALESKSRDYYAEILRRTIDHEIIRTLMYQQGLLDQGGPLKASADDPKFPLAMTLRDCTCFALIPRYSSSTIKRQPIKIRLGDLDWKDPSKKIDRWRSTEAGLISGGYYTSTKITCDGVEYQPPTLCALENQPRQAKPSPVNLRVSAAGEPTSTRTNRAGEIEYPHVSNVGMLKVNLNRLRNLSL